MHVLHLILFTFPLERSINEGRLETETKWWKELITKRKNEWEERRRKEKRNKETNREMRSEIEGEVRQRRLGHLQVNHEKREPVGSLRFSRGFPA